jgi:hypothetical protein
MDVELIGGPTPGVQFQRCAAPSSEVAAHRVECHGKIGNGGQSPIDAEANKECLPALAGGRRPACGPS